MRPAVRAALRSLTLAVLAFGSVASGRPSGEPGPAAAGDTIRLTVAAFFTPEAEAEAVTLGGTIQSFIAGAFADWQVVVDSATAGSTPVLVVPLGPVRLDFAEVGWPCGPELDRFFGDARAHAVRDSLAANLAVLFSNQCSAAYQCVEGSASCPVTAFALARFATAGASGHALAHEAGHLLGMRHDPADDPTPGDNHGHRDEVGGFYTVMAVRGPIPPPPAPYFSDPDRTLNGRPLGVPGVSNNAAVFRRMAPVAATWNTTVATAPGPGADLFSVKAYPNPAASAWTVRLDAPVGEVRLELADVTGRHVWTARAAVRGSTALTVPSVGLPAGTYVLRATWAGPGADQVAHLILTRDR